MAFKLVALFFILTSQSAWSTPIYERHDWLRLVHYEKTIWGGFSNSAKNNAYYVSPNGKTDPKAEFEAVKSALANISTYTGKPDEHPRCLFPARSKWVAKETGLTLPGDDWCPKFIAWKIKVIGRSITYVFSSFHLNNPSSTFGHTLLRLNRRTLEELSGDSEGRQLLDYGVNYGLMAPKVNPVLYGLFALAGAFPGNFLVLPYFYKVREYNDYESRDLWEYDLKLTEAEVETLVDHLWELDKVIYAYHYLTDNCGYQVLAVLDAAAPRLNLVKKLRKWVMPSDTVKIIADSGLVQRVHYRPSIRTQFYHRRADLKTSQELAALDALEKDPLNKEALAPFEPHAQARIVDAAIDLIDLQHPREIMLEESKIKEIKNKLLLVRSKLPISAPLNIPLPESEAPDRSHPSGRLKLSHIWDRGDEHEVEIGYRGALHDLNDAQEGYPRNTKIEFGHFRARRNLTKNRWKLTEATLFSIESLNPWSKYNKKPGWRVEVGLKTSTDDLCVDCLRTGFSTGGGLSYEPANWLTVYGMLGADLQSATQFQHSKLALGVGPLAGMIVRPVKHLSLFAEGREFWYWHNDDFKLFPEFKSTLRYQVHTNWALEGAGKFTRKESEGELALYYYY